MLTRRAIVAATSRPLRTYRPAPISPSRALLARSLSDEAGEHRSGHISTQPGESILFFNNLLPHRLVWAYKLAWTWENRRSILKGKFKFDGVGAASPAEVLSKVTQDGQLGQVDVVEVLPRLKEGGAFLKFRHDSSASAHSIESAVHEHLQQNPIRPWWNPFATVGIGLVVGKPWIEDLFQMPSPRLRVEFLPSEPGAECAELSQEQLYSFFRCYGKLAEINKQPTDSKILPRYSMLDYSSTRSAVMAKNCLHGYKVSPDDGGGKLGTVFRVTYEKKERFGWARDWVYNHPRIAIPLLAALIAGVSIVIFDPLRELSIRAHVDRTFHFEDTFVFRWFKRQGEDLISRVRHFGRGGGNPEAGMQVVWDDRKDEIEQIQSWLMETADTFIVVMGPRGSGKKELVVDHALQHKKDAHRLLVVDCKPVQEARGDAATIAAAAAQVGYRPVFSWVNNISGLADLAAQGMTGVKAGFSETLDAQLSKICNTASAALKSIALDGRRKTDKDANLSDDEYLEAHPELRPVLVVDNFLHRSNEGDSQIVYDKVAQWAAELTMSNVAHVIFLTNDISYSKSLSKALPDRVFRQIALGDCSPETAKRYVINHLDFDADPGRVLRESEKDGDEEVSLTPSQKRKDLYELDAVIGQLGGRLTDLEFVARRIKAGETPTKAVQEIVDQSASEILKMFLLGASDERAWSSTQAWTLVKSLAGQDTLRYNEVLLADAFKNAGAAGERALAALEQAELVAVQSLNGRPHSVRPGKPVYLAAFRQLVHDRVLRARMDLAVHTDAIAAEGKTIDKCEQELRLLADLPKQPGELHARVQWLLSKVSASQSKIESLERDSAGLKKILLSEY